MLEYELVREIIHDCSNIKGNNNRIKYEKIAKAYYKHIYGDKDRFVRICYALLETRHSFVMTIVTAWIKKGRFYDESYLLTYEKWLHSYIDTWWDCDLFCYRVLNPMIEKHNEGKIKVLLWANSSSIYVKRAALVSLIHSSREFSVNVDFELVMNVVEVLKFDNEYYVQKAIGWLLKYSYLTYPEKTLEYITYIQPAIPPDTLRYALEKVPKEVKTRFLKNNII